jgi:heterotetrameric sarcosine oxidase gamma subunit
MTLGFLTPVTDPEAGPPASSPLEPWLREAGAIFMERDGWRIAASFGDPDGELQALRRSAGLADQSSMGKFELQGTPGALGSLLAGAVPGGPPAPGEASDLDGGHLWLSSPDRALAICDPAETANLAELLQALCVSPHCGLVEITAGLAAFEARGPRARDLLERVTAIDVRDTSLPVGGVRAGAVAEVPATLIRPDDEAFLVLVGAQEAPDAWEIVLDAGTPLGVRPAGAEALGRIERRKGALARA